MANFLNVEDLTKSYGDRLLMDGLTFGVAEGDKIGIVAKNGTGKSTLLRMLAGVESPDSGKITFRNDIKVAFLEQLPEFAPESTVLDAALDTDDVLAILVKRYEESIAANDSDATAAIAHEMDCRQAWDYLDRLRQTLSMLGIPDLNARMGSLSGGQRKRVALARVIISNPDFLILDEPTNHLDIKMVEWLENYLLRSRMTLLMVTHDRYFLDRVCTRIIELDNRTVYICDGNFDYYLRRRAERIEAMGAELVRVRNTLRREQEWMRRQPQARAGKAKYRIDSFYDLKERSRVNLSEKSVELHAQSSYIGTKIFEAERVCKRYGDKIILDDFTYTFARGEKLGIVGGNGVGKSTFIKMLQGLIPADSGEWNIGSTVRFGYYSQDGITFNSSKKVIDAVTEIADDIVLGGGERISPIPYLQRFLFSGADQQKYIHTLSGGERCRLHLAVVLMQQPNFLILDEPTNDLDIVTLGILEEFLSEFKGCLIVISHDRFFIDSTVDHIFVMEGQGVIKDFPGTYSDYKQWAEKQKTVELKKTTTASPKSERRHAERPARMTFAERKEFEALDKEIEELSTEKKKLEAYFNAGGGDDIAEKSQRYSIVGNLLDEKELRWLELSEKA